MMDYLAMGGYGFYVWGSYGVAALAFIAEVISVRARRRRALADARIDEQDGVTVGKISEVLR